MEIKLLKETNEFEEFLMEGLYCGFVINGEKFISYEKIKTMYDLGKIKVIKENEDGQYIFGNENGEKNTIEIL